VGILVVVGTVRGRTVRDVPSYPATSAPSAVHDREPLVHRPLTREEALRLLELDDRPGARPDRAAAKRAYRQLARTHHPDRGGDAETFHRLRLAYERLADDATEAAPQVSRGRPSRAHAPVQEDPGRADLGSVVWDRPVPTGRTRLDRDLVATWLARTHAAPVLPLLAASRAPGSRLNAIAVHLSPDLASRLRVVPARDDRHREVVAIEVTATPRRARRALDHASLEGRWTRTRGSSSTTLRTLLAPSDDRRTTAVRCADRLEPLLDHLDWPLAAWTLSIEQRSG
jgi:hypothetical protein